jgi:hypothetical protein
MKKIFLPILLACLCLAHLPANAQCYDCIKKEKDNDWRLAVGITLYSNNKYILKEEFLERRPVELTGRYKFRPHHVLRFQLPFSSKVNMHREASYETPFLNGIMSKNADNKAYELWQEMQSNPFDFVRTNQIYYHLWGASLGYDYDRHLIRNLSVFGGFDLSYTYLKFHMDYFRVGFSKLDEENTAQLSPISYIINEHRNNCFAVKPLLGCRYLFQKKLLIECSIGYGWTFGKIKGTQTSQSYNSNESNRTLFERKNDFNQVITQLSLHYSF